MTDPVRQQLRDALTERADAFPYERAMARLSGVDYAPRYGHRLSARVVGALSASGTAVIAAVIAVILTVGGTPNPAFAGWTPAPKVLTSSQLSTVAHSVLAHWASKCSGPGGSIVLADVRGRYTFALWVTNATAPVSLATICLNGVPDGSGATGSSSIAADRVRGGLTEYGTISNQAGVVSPYEFTMVGRVGIDVRSVSVLLSTGTKVKATVANGWYLVWWPAKDGYSKKLIVTATGPSGSHTYATADSNGKLPGGCGAGPATNAAQIRAEAKRQRDRQQERLKLQREQLTPQQQRIKLRAWLRQHGYLVPGEKAQRRPRGC
jgi:hypothetical protein